MVLGVSVWMVKKLEFRIKGLGLPGANWALPPTWMHQSYLLPSEVDGFVVSVSATSH